MPVLERIERGDLEGIRVGRFGGRINTTCLLYRLGDTLVDTGPANQWPTVRRFLLERPVERVLVTHHHEDHSGNMAPIQKTLERPLLSPAASLAPLEGGFPLQLYRRLVWGRPERVRAEPLPGSIPVAGAGALEPVPAPGHSTDMTCFLLRERGWLFTGDLFIASRPRYLRADEDVGAQIESLRRVLELDFDTLLCSHRGLVEEGKEALRRKLDYLVSLCERVRELRARGLDSRRITRELLGREDLMTWATGFHFAKRNLIASCLEAVEG